MLSAKALIYFNIFSFYLKSNFHNTVYMAFSIYGMTRTGHYFMMKIASRG